MLGQAVALCVCDEHSRAVECVELELPGSGSGSLSHRTQGPPLATSSPSYDQTVPLPLPRPPTYLPPPPSSTVNFLTQSSSTQVGQATETALHADFPIDFLILNAHTPSLSLSYLFSRHSYVTHRHDSDLRPGLYSSVVIV